FVVDLGDDTDFDQRSNVASIWKRLMLYGLAPSFPGETYWSRKELYERDKDITDRYLPVVRQVAAAGWEPVTLATCSDSEIRIERFGPSEGNVYLAVYNASGIAKDFEVNLDPALGTTEAISCRFSGKTLPALRSAQLSLEPNGIELLTLKCDS